MVSVTLLSMLAIVGSLQPRVGAEGQSKSAAGRATVLEGTAKGSDGRPIANALVAVGSAVSGAGELPMSARTDSRGSFRIPVAHSGLYMLTIDARGWARVTLERVK